MKKIITLLIGIFCVLAVSAQVTPSGNGFIEQFDYPDGTVFDDVEYEGIWIEWPIDGTVVDPTYGQFIASSPTICPCSKPSIEAASGSGILEESWIFVHR